MAVDLVTLLFDTSQLNSCTHGQPETNLAWKDLCDKIECNSKPSKYNQTTEKLNNGEVIKCPYRKHLVLDLDEELAFGFHSERIFMNVLNV